MIRLLAPPITTPERSRKVETKASPAGAAEGATISEMDNRWRGGVYFSGNR